MHRLTLELPDEVYEPLLQQAERNATTPEALLSQWAGSITASDMEDPLLCLLGSLEFKAGDVSARHDELIGRSLQENNR